MSSSSINPFSLHCERSLDVPSHTRENSQGLRNSENLHAQDESDRNATAISALSDNVFLEIFDFYRKDQNDILHERTLWILWTWHLLVHVCHRWRQIVFASPRRLNVQIFCTYGTPVRKNLGIWPAFPIVMDYNYRSGIMPNDEDNVIVALKHLHRVCGVRLVVMGSQLRRTAGVMQEPFPVLTRLWISSVSKDREAPALPAEFLGGSAPCLQEFGLDRIAYPTLPTLLLSATGLVKLHLRDIPLAGYISPEALVVGLATLSRLECFILEFQSATPRPYQIRPPSVTRSVLPSLIFFHFQGASEYLEDLVSRIDCPRMNKISTVYLNQLVDFQVEQFSEFINRSVGPEITLCKGLGVTFFSGGVSIDIYPHPIHYYRDPSPTTTTILCEGIDWQVFHVAQVLGKISNSLLNVVHLKLEVRLEEDEDYQLFLEAADNVEWLHLFHQFSTIQTLHVHRELTVLIAIALEDITAETVAEVMPSLDLIYFEGTPAPSVKKFLAARRRSGYTVTTVNTATAFNQRLQNYGSVNPTSLMNPT